MLYRKKASYKRVIDTKCFVFKTKNKITFVCGYYKDEFEKNKIWKQRS